MNNQKPDVVIPLIKGGSRNNDLELRYCLRSIEKYLTGYGGIIIVGHLPEFIKPDSIIHIPSKDGSHKQNNIRTKILAAFGVSTGQIWFTNDDLFLLQPFIASNFPFYYSGDLKDVSEKAARYFAFNELTEKMLPTKQFDCHTPILYEREKFKEAIINFSEDCSIKSTYANYWQIEGEFLKDLKISSHLRYHTIKKEIAGRPCFSIGDYGLNEDMKRVLQELLPNPSKYELTQQIKAA